MDEGRISDGTTVNIPTMAPRFTPKHRSAHDAPSPVIPTKIQGNRLI